MQVSIIRMVFLEKKSMESNRVTWQQLKALMIIGTMCIYLHLLMEITKWK